MATSGGADPALGRARGAVSRLAWDEAVAAFASAAAENPDALTPGDLRHWALAAYLHGDVSTATVTLTRAHRAALAEDDRDEAIRCVFWQVYVLITVGEAAQAAGWAVRCDALADAMEPDGIGAAYRLALASHRAAAMERDEGSALDLASRGVAVARRCDEPDALALLLNTEGRVLLRSGRLSEGWARLDECLVQVASGDLSPVAAGTVYCSLIEACEEVGEVARVREWTEALTRWCSRQSGMATFMGQCLTHRSFVLRLEGAYQAAAEAALTACDRFAGAADVAATGRAFEQLGEARLRQGRLDEAEAAFLQATEWGADPQPGLALVRLGQGDPEAAAAMIRRVLAEHADPLDRLRPLPAAVEILLEVGDIEGARLASRELAAAADRFDTSAMRAAAASAEARVALADDRPELAASRGRDAVRMWRELDMPYESARTRDLVGRACAALGDAETARIEQDGARRALELLRTADEAAAGPPLAGAEHGLSPRELQVLRLVSTGRTNRQVAEALSLSVKTVDRHVGNVLAKLEVPSRTAAAAYAYEHGLVGGGRPAGG